MDQVSYGQQAMVGATGVELVIALYDAALRNLYAARQGARKIGNVSRSANGAVKKAHRHHHVPAGTACDRTLAVMRLRSRSADFYAAMFTMALEASHSESAVGFEEVILCIQNVRDAWVIVAQKTRRRGGFCRESFARGKSGLWPRSEEPTVQQPRVCDWSA